MSYWGTAYSSRPFFLLPWHGRQLKHPINCFNLCYWYIIPKGQCSVECSYTPFSSACSSGQVTYTSIPQLEFLSAMDFSAGRFQSEYTPSSFLLLRGKIFWQLLMLNVYGIISTVNSSLLMQHFHVHGSFWEVGHRFFNFIAFMGRLLLLFNYFLLMTVFWVYSFCI